MKQHLLRPIGWALSRPAVAKALISLAKRRPYTPITDGSTLYMERNWIFNPYHKVGTDVHNPRHCRWLPSVRHHHIVRADSDRHLHDHPSSFISVVLRGSYSEERYLPGTRIPVSRIREQGDIGGMGPGDFHRISSVSEGGVDTLFITWGRAHDWGFDVNGRKILSRDYFRGHYQ